jgi:hypothetical protein
LFFCCFVLFLFSVHLSQQNTIPVQTLR